MAERVADDVGAGRHEVPREEEPGPGGEIAGSADADHRMSRHVLCAHAWTVPLHPADEPAPTGQRTGLPTFMIVTLLLSLLATMALEPSGVTAIIEAPSPAGTVPVTWPSRLLTTLTFLASSLTM